MSANKVTAILSRDECLEVVRSEFGASTELISHQVESFQNELMGFLGEYYKLTCEIRKNTSSDITKCAYFIKTIPIVMETMKETVIRLRVFPKETTLYQKLFKDLEKCSISKWRSECYFSRDDILVMEDLQLSGFNLLNGNESFSIQHMEAALQSLASMHASSLVYEETMGADIRESYGHVLHEIIVSKRSGFWGAGLAAIQAVALHHPNFQGTAEQNFLRNTFLNRLHSLKELTQPSDTYRNVFCHRDVWGKNILFRTNPDDDTKLQCVFVDFQNCIYNPPAVDVLFLLYLNMERNEREANSPNLLRFYYDRLHENCRVQNVNLSEIISWEEFLKSCGCVEPLILAINAVYVPIVNIPHEFYTEFRKTSPEQYRTMMEEDRNEQIFEFMASDAKYRQIVLSVVEDVVNCMLKKIVF